MLKGKPTNFLSISFQGKYSQREGERDDGGD